MREGIELHISQFHNKDRVIVSRPEAECDELGWFFWLSGNEEWRVKSALGETSYAVDTGKYLLHSAGSRDQLSNNYDQGTLSQIYLIISQNVFRSFAALPEEELPKYLQHLDRSIRQDIYCRIGRTQPTMAAVLQQILHCPYQGMIKRAYLEGKVIELMALVLENEDTTQQEAIQKKSQA
ncbi:MAG: hypothetical protein AAGD25_35925 [Cyanobacteria bacterium P01_F01_bin.150]